MTIARSMFVLGMVAAAGCATMRDRGDSLYAQGKYEEAAGAYDTYLQSHPSDKKARAGRRAARMHMLRERLVGVQRARVAGKSDASASALASLLIASDGWGEQLDPDLVAAIQLEVANASARIGAEVAAAIETTGPLGGEDVAETYSALLAQTDLQTTKGAIHTQLVEAGHIRCSALAATTADGEPYWAWLVARYCGHWGTTRAVPMLPEQRAALAVDGGVDGETERQGDDLRAALARVFEKSAWFAATARGSGHATVSGSLAVDAAEHPVTLTATWTESVPYTDYETRSESYQEPYDDTETYTESVPSTEYRTESVPCSDPNETSCTNQVVETAYHDETRTRTVTKYRTAWRDVTEPVTRYRDESRSQDYQAIQRSATYRADLRVRVDGGLPAITASTDADTSESGYDHDVTISEAGVSPSRANLTSQAEFASQQRDALDQALLDSLDTAYKQRFCMQPRYSVDEAARCAYAGTAELPAPVRGSLRARLGAEADHLAALSR